MKTFSTWVENNRDLAAAYKRATHGVPQDPTHHAEGDVLKHIRLVRKALPRAIEELDRVKQSHPQLSYVLKDIDFSLTPTEWDVLALSAWLHDIGKDTATEMDGQHWREPGASGRITAYGHQDPEHFLPQIEKLREFAPQKIIDLYDNNKETVDWLIQRHMDFVQDRFPKHVIYSADPEKPAHFSGGKIVPSSKIKLLLILMWADKMGRIPEEVVLKGVSKNAERLATSAAWGKRKEDNIAAHKKPAFSGSPEEFANMMNAKGLDRQSKMGATRGKFGQISDDELNALYPESFKSWLAQN